MKSYDFALKVYILMLIGALFICELLRIAYAVCPLLSHFRYISTHLIFTIENAVKGDKHGNKGKTKLQHF